MYKQNICNYNNTDRIVIIFRQVYLLFIQVKINNLQIAQCSNVHKPPDQPLHKSNNILRIFYTKQQQLFCMKRCWDLGCNAEILILMHLLYFSLMYYVLDQNYIKKFLSFLPKVNIQCMHLACIHYISMYLNIGYNFYAHCLLIQSCKCQLMGWNKSLYAIAYNIICYILRGIQFLIYMQQIIGRKNYQLNIQIFIFPVTIKYL
eukprot:TRINITY_DN3772_c0_g1_i9.p2 TRINITY_DN3772_c0_g1~~TRINITY_DN3772_c0_g1_i9.p2  ORF type:complete len:204 (-),score=-20.12 TRINITY_DN3772_c0_g1_i9:209-820(-)